MMKTSNGFSLIEMAVVLIIIGLLMGGLLSPLSASLSLHKIKLTQQRLEEIKEALLGFAIINERLPCPAPNKNGLALDVGDTDCQNEGYLPWAELGVGRYDAWGNPFRYRVEEEYTNTTTIIVPIPASDLRVKNGQEDYLTNKSDDSRVVAIILSYGQNGQAEDENQTVNQLYRQDGYIENQFDDVLTWLSINTLMNRLVIVGKWPLNP
ncbi:MAG TPA: prepilin-type N-terminal cleavage/methylation domain-containing protein [Thiotrichaceae bacterium]|nr:prepilin-type N-terminal cleavage/methylation domain-containing protein [Thiotrichaceae bacterium]